VLRRFSLFVLVLSRATTLREIVLITKCLSCNLFVTQALIVYNAVIGLGYRMFLRNADVTNIEDRVAMEEHMLMLEQLQSVYGVGSQKAHSAAFPLFGLPINGWTSEMCVAIIKVT